MASRSPGPVKVLPPSTAVSIRPGGNDPPTFHEPMLIVLVTVIPTGVIATPTLALSGLDWVVESTVAPASVS